MSSFKVSNSAVEWLTKALQNHTEVEDVYVTDHHFFHIKRKKSPTEINVVLVDLYTVGISDVMTAQDEFPTANCIVTNGAWNAYTSAAKEYGIEHQFGVFKMGELLGALRWEEFYKYKKPDGNGGKTYKH